MIMVMVMADTITMAIRIPLMTIPLAAGLPCAYRWLFYAC